MLKWIYRLILVSNQNMITREIRKILNPYLVWESRVNLNAALPKSCRVYTRMSWKKCIAHELYFLKTIYMAKSQRFHEAVGATQKCERIFELFSSYDNPRMWLLMSCYPSYKNINIDRLLYFADKKHLLSASVDPKLVHRVVVLCQRMVLKVMILKIIKLPTNMNHGFIQIL